MSLRSYILSLLRGVNEDAVAIAVVCLLCLFAIWWLAPTPQCLEQFNYSIRPEGYNWRPERSANPSPSYYGYDPFEKRRLYVGRDGRYYVVNHPGSIGPDDLRNTWCPHDVGTPATARSRFSGIIATLSSIFAHHDRLVNFNYLRRPSGYHWQAQLYPNGGAPGYYGKDPSNGWTVFVGHDNIYYSFPHGPPLTAADLASVWQPHNAGTPEY